MAGEGFVSREVLAVEATRRYGYPYSEGLRCHLSRCLNAAE